MGQCVVLIFCKVDGICVEVCIWTHKVYGNLLNNSTRWWWHLVDNIDRPIINTAALALPVANPNEIFKIKQVYH